MTLELILWLVAWVVISEGFFIFISLKDLTVFTWVGDKFISFFVGGFFISIQAVIVFSSGGDPNVLFDESHYIHLLYEVIILGAIGVLFLCNRLIVGKIEKSKEEKEKKGKK